MKELVVISGKGGTGKTSLTAAFASMATNKILCDADVDAADLHLILDPNILRRTDFSAGHTAIINTEPCSECGLCRELCKWNAISDAFCVDPILCEGCGVCAYFCPEKAIDFPEKVCGEWFVSETRLGPMVHACLGIAEENSGKLVTLVRQESQKLASERGIDLIITDGPPGIGCPVIAGIGGADAVLIVAEPTVSGVHDMKRVADLATFFKVPVMVCVNKADINPDKTDEIEAFAKENGYMYLGEIPFDPVFTKSMVNRQTIFEYNSQSDATAAIKRIWEKIATQIGI